MKATKIFHTGWRILFAGIFIVSFLQTTPVYAATIDLQVEKVLNGASTFTQAENDRTYTITVKNEGDMSSSGTITVTDILPAGLTAIAINGGTYWSCTLGTLICTTANSIHWNDGVTNHVSDPITITVDVAVDAAPIPPNNITNTVNVSGGGDTDPTGNQDTVITNVIQKPDIIITGYELRNEANDTVITTVNPDESFYIRMTVRNRGGEDTGLFYPGVFLDDKPNYGPDHDPFGEVTDWSDFLITTATPENNSGCFYYDPNGTININTTQVSPERGNYTRSSYNSAIPAGGEVEVDVLIGYPDSEVEYQNSQYDPYRTGLPAGSYSIYLYADPTCSGGIEESFEDNNSYGPINLDVGVIYPPTTLVNSVLPTSRTPFVGSPVTIFNTVLNAGANPAGGVTLSMSNPPAGIFSYSQTNCANNSVIGGINPSITIPVGGVACYVLTFTPSAPFAATNVHIRAQATNAPSTNLLLGINTWLLRSTASPGPDIIALTTTTDFHQVACSGTMAFAVASSNVGTATTGNITVTANTGAVSLPIGVLIQETNPSTGVIIGDNVLENIGAGENRTVVVFVTFGGCVTFDPANHRIFIEFRDASNNVVGSTSTAVSTNR